MPKSATSPSDFIYQRSRGSCPLTVSRQDNSTMDLEEYKASGSCQRPGSLSSAHVPWEVINPVLPDCGQTRWPVTPPNSQILHGHHGLQQGTPFGNHGPPPDLRHLCSSCHCQLESLDPSSACLSQVTTTAGFEPKSEPAYFSTNADPQHDARIILDCPPLPSSQGLKLPASPSPTALPDRPLSATRSSLSIPSSTTEQTIHMCAIVHAVHDVCLRSTKTYLDSHLANRRARASNSSPLASRSVSTSRSKLKTDDSSSSSRVVGDNTTSIRNVSGNERGNTLSLIPTPTNSLLKNISGICTMLWAGSQINRLDVLNVERTAVDNMGRLLCWAETVTLSDSDEWRSAEEDVLWRVLEAGSNLCAWLGVPDGIQTMSRLESDARNLGYGVL
ncbi:hypothetical protein F4818DRAFT_225692 [Hypoxylon cercidicola]|nr:hypothetical protein F4818DRAFT_225692 [Hypoxylon cercidicola]